MRPNARADFWSSSRSTKGFAGVMAPKAGLGACLLDAEEMILVDIQLFFGDQT